MLSQITDSLNAFRKQLSTDGLRDKTIFLFREILWNYYTTNKRDFPWRHTADLPDDEHILMTFPGIGKASCEVH